MNLVPLARSSTAMYGVVLILSLAAAAADPAERSLPLMTAAEAQAAMQRGEAQFRAGNWPEAERLLAEVLRASEAGLLKPAARTRCLGLLASTYARLDRDREAIGFGLRSRDSLKSLPSDPAAPGPGPARERHLPGRAVRQGQALRRGRGRARRGPGRPGPRGPHSEGPVSGDPRPPRPCGACPRGGPSPTGDRAGPPR